ncbi:hypothetical protein ACFQ0R_00155 [Psychroflexus salinarum]|uniref:CarboxypepD_reg-like domain-containing protein n=1 Tax=Psychroflexus salinarum TaxID=546024 RepID=A0ABW3GK47_9FLAO
MKVLFYIFIILFSTQTFSQQLTGYLYDQNGRVPNFPISNTTQDLNLTSNSEGYFEIQANAGDSIVLRSVAYKTYIFEVQANQIGNDIVIELEPDNLDEVVVYGYKIDSNTLSKNLKNSIQKDIIKNPTLYEPSKGNIGYLIHRLFGLFKTNKKSKDQPVKERLLETQDFIFLFKSDEILNTAFLVEELKLSEKYQHLFLDFLGSKKMSFHYLDKDKKLELIDLIYKYHAEYKSVINSSKSDDQ